MLKPITVIAVAALAAFTLTAGDAACCKKDAKDCPEKAKKDCCGKCGGKKAKAHNHDAKSHDAKKTTPAPNANANDGVVGIVEEEITVTETAVPAAGAQGQQQTQPAAAPTK